MDPLPDDRKKGNYVGAPAIFALETACQQLRESFGEYGIYIVGSVLKRPDWRDVDLRYILRDDLFAELFPDAGRHWEQNPRWLLLTEAISDLLKKRTGLPIDFQFQPQTHANEVHKGKPRHSIGIRIKDDKPCT